MSTTDRTADRTTDQDDSPTNPLLGVADIAGLAGVAREHDLLLVVDNTFATPYLQTPIALGAHAVVHSTTKYLGGHSDVIGGAVVTDDDRLDTTLGRMQNGMGAVPSPFDYPANAEVLIVTDVKRGDLPALANAMRG